MYAFHDDSILAWSFHAWKELVQRLLELGLTSGPRAPGDGDMNRHGRNATLHSADDDRPRYGTLRLVTAAARDNVRRPGGLRSFVNHCVTVFHACTVSARVLFD